MLQAQERERRKKIEDRHSWPSNWGRSFGVHSPMKMITLSVKHILFIFGAVLSSRPADAGNSTTTRPSYTYVEKKSGSGTVTGCLLGGLVLTVGVCFALRRRRGKQRLLRRQQQWEADMADASTVDMMVNPLARAYSPQLAGGGGGGNRTFQRDVLLWAYHDRQASSAQPSNDDSVVTTSVSSPWGRAPLETAPSLAERVLQDNAQTLRKNFHFDHFVIEKNDHGAADPTYSGYDAPLQQTSMPISNNVPAATSAYASPKTSTLNARGQQDAAYYEWAPGAAIDDASANVGGGKVAGGVAASMVYATYSPCRSSSGTESGGRPNAAHTLAAVGATAVADSTYSGLLMSTAGYDASLNSNFNQRQVVPLPSHATATTTSTSTSAGSAGAGPGPGASRLEHKHEAEHIIYAIPFEGGGR